MGMVVDAGRREAKGQVVDAEGDGTAADEALEIRWDLVREQVPQHEKSPSNTEDCSGRPCGKGRRKLVGQQARSDAGKGVDRQKRGSPNQNLKNQAEIKQRQ